MNKMQSVVSVVVIFLSLLFCNLIFAEDGTYDATIITDSGSYSVPVEV